MRSDQNILYVRDGDRLIEVPFEEGEKVLSAVRRHLPIKSPCRGDGWCGGCRIDIEQEDGSLKFALACQTKCRPMTIRIFYKPKG